MEDCHVEEFNEKDINNPIYFWEKLALKPEKEEKDMMKCYGIDNDRSIRDVIRNLESKLIGQKLSFNDVHPKNSSVKKWINIIKTSYPEKNESVAEDILNTFRDNLYPRSKESHKIIVGLLLMKDVILLVHSKKDPSLAEIGERIHSVKLILHPKNILRASMIKIEDGETIFSAFEYSRHWSKGHADFWGIEPEYVTWNALGNIVLTIEMECFCRPIQLPIEAEDLDEMVKKKEIIPNGKIRLGREEGKVTHVNVFRKSLGFPEFYDFYVSGKERLEEHRIRFKELVTPTILQNYNLSSNKYQYEDDIDKVLEITADGKKVVCNKEHPRFTICYFTKHHPVIKPTNKLIHKLYQAIFDNTSLDIYHPGEKISENPITIGCLNIYNYIDLNPDINEISTNFLNIIQDANSKKTKSIMQYHFCEFWKMNIKNHHLKAIFDYIQEQIINPDLEFEFKTGGILETEGYLEFKSSSQWVPSPAKFVDRTLIPTLNKYTEGVIPSRLCVIYGIEDNGEITPLHHIKSDQIKYIEEETNDRLKTKGLKVAVQPIPFKEENILLVYIIPLVGS